jgi:uncharacterized protein YegL
MFRYSYKTNSLVGNFFSTKRKRRDTLQGGQAAGLNRWGGTPPLYDTTEFDLSQQNAKSRRRRRRAMAVSLVIHALFCLLFTKLYLEKLDYSQEYIDRIEIVEVAEVPPPLKLKKPKIPLKRPGAIPRATQREIAEPTPQELPTDSTDTPDTEIETVIRVETDTPDTIQPDTSDESYNTRVDVTTSNPAFTSESPSFSATTVEAVSEATIRTESTLKPSASPIPIARRTQAQAISSRQESGPLTEQEPIISSGNRSTDEKRAKGAGQRVRNIKASSGKTRQGSPKFDGRGKVDLGDGDGGGHGPDQVVGWEDFGKMLKDGNKKARLQGGPLRVVFLLDKSGSMHGKKIELAISALKDAITDLKENENFYLVLFDSHLHRHKPKFVQATKDNKNDAFAYLDQQSAGTGTNISQVFENVFKRQTASLIWFISDGEPSEGVRDTRALVNLITKSNRNGTTIHTIGLGAGSFRGTTLMSQIAKSNNGGFRGIDISGY